MEPRLSSPLAPRPDALVGRVVVVSGASGRLGRALVRGFAGAGATVVPLVEPGAAAPPPAVAADLTDEAAAEAAFSAVVARHGPPDVFVHAVGAWDAAPLVDTTLAAWRALVDVNLTSAFLGFREAMRHMAGRGGRLVAFAARQGADRGAAEQAAYSAAKAGLVRLVESAAAEGGGRVTAHALALSTLVDDRAEPGVCVDDVVAACLVLASGLGDAANGSVVRLYGLAG